MDSEQFREAAHAAIEDIISYVKELPTLRVTPSISPGYLRPQLPERPPEEPEPWHQVIEDTGTKIKPGLTHWQSPNFMAFFPAMTSFPSMIAELYSAAFSAPAFNWVCSPACTELETIMLDWVAEIFGLPDVFKSTAAPEDGKDMGGGVIQGSASEAVVVSMTAAREKHVRLALEKAELLHVDEKDCSERSRAREDLAASIRGRLVAIGSEQCHSSTHKAANILGLRYRTVRAAPGNGFGLTAETVKASLCEIEESGLIPCYITLSMGTTTTCAVDDFEGIAALKKEYPDLWVHVDAAYAGSALVCEEMREDLNAQWLGEFDSLDMNMHKWLLTNFDCR
ncbi:MAG: hypothetical protein M1831_004248 [Alyxoria varia]|nr:MAG: hypothetical protein M1831_004248 [Alyxoria varia]